MARSTTKQKENKGMVSTIAGWHPYKTFLYLSILGITILFAFFIIAFEFTKQPSIHIDHFPKAFIVSTFVLMLSSIALGDVLTLFDKDKILAIRNKLIFTCFLGIIFTLVQLLGWQELVSRGIRLQGVVSGSYLYIISGLHLVHLAGGIIFIYVETIKIWQRSKDPVKTLIYFTDPFQKLKLELLRTYWNFMDILWVGIFFYFLFSL